MGVGGLGTLTATKPVAWAQELMDWRGLFFVLAVTTGTSAVLVGLCLPKFKLRDGTGGFRKQLRGLATIYGNRLF